jgi:hypothetical protein
MSRLTDLALTAAAALIAVAAAADDGPPPARPLPLGEICGDPALLGQSLPPVTEAGGCGIPAPVRLSAAAGVALEPPPTLDCQAARALVDWLAAIAPVLAETGAEVAAITVIDAYSCRNRNRATDGKLSEHAFGRAIDIAGLRLDDDRVVTVRDGWTSPEWGPTLHRLHDAGCGPFRTVLGPEANPLHADHLHFDMASRKSGPYCE